MLKQTWPYEKAATEEMSKGKQQCRATQNCRNPYQKAKFCQTFQGIKANPEIFIPL